MPSTFSIRRRVEFSETDMAGIVHFSNFFRYMESAEHAFFRSLGHSIVTSTTNPPVGWPRVHADCDYTKPLRFEDEVEIELTVLEKRSRALKHGFRFFKISGEEREQVATGTIVAVCVQKGPDGTMGACPIPDEIASQIEAATPEPQKGS